MRKVMTAAVVLGFAGFGALALGFGDVAGSGAAIPWEHGLKTDRIIATRYKNEHFKYNIGFRYIRASDDAKADTAEVADFFDKQGCEIFHGGGAPFSEYFVVCKDVTDQASANIKLKTLLPALDKFIRALS